MDEQLRIWARELDVLRALTTQTIGEPEDEAADEVHCIAGRVEQIARDMRRAVERTASQRAATGAA